MTSQHAVFRPHGQPGVMSGRPAGEPLSVMVVCDGDAGGGDPGEAWSASSVV